MSDDQESSIEVSDFEMDGNFGGGQAITILPSSIKVSKDKYEYSSCAISFCKFAKKQLDIGYLTKPEALYEQRSSDVFLPTILFTVDQLTNHSDVIRMFVEVAINFVKETMAGKDEPTVHVSLVSKETDSEKYVRVMYKGPMEGLKSIESTFLKAIKHEK